MLSTDKGDKMVEINMLKADNRIRRFHTGRIIEHWIALVTFIILVSTGLTQKFYPLDISQWFIMKSGGIDNVRLIHRYTGIIFSLAAIVHIITGIIGVVFKGWQPSMIINKNDFTDITHNIRYYLGMENHPARCDRYDYKQKFEYWGVIIGGILMIATGAILWFPITVAKYLPGEIIPAAKALHTNVAFVIFIITALWHIYNSIFSPEVFPLDTSIFTGYISRDRMIREHPLELARMEGKPLDEIVAQSPGNDLKTS